MAGYLIDKDKGKCYGCEACVQICPKSALKMEEDDEGFRYPILNKDLCVKCNLCHQVCLYENMPVRYGKDKYEILEFHRRSYSSAMKLIHSKRLLIRLYGITDQMDNTPLNGYIGEDCFGTFFQTTYAIHGKKQNIFNSTIFDFIKNLHPLMFAL